MKRDDSNAVYLGVVVGLAVGFGLGALLFRSAPEKVVPASRSIEVEPPIEVPRPTASGTLKAAEELFERWGGYAIWEDDVTEIALWNHARQRHADFYEVRRANGEFYFRTLKALTRPLIDHGPRGRLPIVFTEPQWMRDRFYRENPGYMPNSGPVEDLPPRAPERRGFEEKGHSRAADETAPRPTGG